MMASSSTSKSVVFSETFEQKQHAVDSNAIMQQAPLNQPDRSLSDGPVAIFWDIENCPVPSDVRPEDVGGNIRMALQVHPIIKGAVITFCAYGDFNAFPRRLREGCQRTGVKLVDVPNGRKDAADKAILIDMFLFALDNLPPSSIMLISGDVDFAPALHILGQRGYNVILVFPFNVAVSSALSNAGKFVWDWPSVARGEGFVPPARGLMPHRGWPVDLAGNPVGCHINENQNAQNEETVVYMGISQGCYNSRDFSLVSQSLAEYNSNSSMMPCFPTNLRSQSLPSGLNEVSTGPSIFIDNKESTLWVQPGDLNGLKGQLVRLLELSGGGLPLNRVPAEYQKVYGRPLYVSEYGALKLVNLFKKMGDTMVLEGKCHNKYVYLRNLKATPSAPPLVLARKESRKEKGNQEECMDTVNGTGSSDELSDEERVVIEETDERRGQMEVNYGPACRMETNDSVLKQFKYELQDILVSYSCRIFLGCFEAIYLQRYKKPLEYHKFGVNQLEELFEKVKDVVVLHEEPVSKRKFLAAVGG